MTKFITGWSPTSWLLAYASKGGNMSDAIMALEDVHYHYTTYQHPVQDVPVSEELPPIEELPPTDELPPASEDYSEEYIPEPTEIENREEDTGQNVDTFA